MAKFRLGNLVATAAVAKRIESDQAFHHFVVKSISRFKDGDWGEVSEDDEELFDQSVRRGSGMLQGVYTSKTGVTIWIVTEWDWNTTTVLFPQEW